MTPINFIGLGFSNPLWNDLCNYFTDNFNDYIDKFKCRESGLEAYIENELHCTLMYNESYQLGKNYTEVHLRMGDQTKSAFNNLVETEYLILPAFKLDTFKNADSIVLKINLDDSNMYSDMKVIHDHFNSLAINPDNYPDYHAHFTISYLNPGTTDEELFNIINNITERFSDQMINFKLESLMISNRDEKLSEIIPLI